MLRLRLSSQTWPQSPRRCVGVGAGGRVGVWVWVLCVYGRETERETEREREREMLVYKAFSYLCMRP